MKDRAFECGKTASRACCSSIRRSTPPGAGTSLWCATTATGASRTTASGSLSTDVAVVGAGIAGLSTALHLAEAGIETIVLEAEEPGSGATGVSGGLIAPDFARNGLASAVRLHGRECAERLARLVGGSGAFTFELIERYGIECDCQAQGFASPGSTESELRAMSADAETWRDLGFDVRLLDAKATAEAIGTDAYPGALLFPHGGALNPLAYVRGLADAAERAGAAIFTRSPVRRLDKADAGWILRTPSATVEARRVVLAANGGNGLLHPALARMTLPLSVYEYATAPLAEADRLRYFDGAVPFTDRNTYVFTARLDGAGRLISAVPGRFPEWTDKALAREAERRLRAVYPEIPVSIEYVWNGTAWLGSTLLPLVLVPEGETDLLVIQACNGRGLGINTSIGREVAGFLGHGDADALAVPLSRPKPVRLHALASRAPKLLMTMAHFRDRLHRR